MGITPGFLKPALRNLKEITADVAMSVPVIGESIYNDFTGKTHLAIPRMAKDMLVGWGQGIEAATPLPDGSPQDAGGRRARALGRPGRGREERTSSGWRRSGTSAPSPRSSTSTPPSR